MHALVGKMPTYFRAIKWPQLPYWRQYFSISPAFSYQDIGQIWKIEESQIANLHCSALCRDHLGSAGGLAGCWWTMSAGSLPFLLSNSVYRHIRLFMTLTLTIQLLHFSGTHVKRSQLNDWVTYCLIRQRSVVNGCTALASCLTFNYLPSKLD